MNNQKFIPSNHVGELSKEYINKWNQYKIFQKTKMEDLQKLKNERDQKKLELEQTELREYMDKYNIPERNVINVAFAHVDILKLKEPTLVPKKLNSREFDLNKAFVFKTALSPFTTIYANRSFFDRDYDKMSEDPNIKTLKDVLNHQCEFDPTERFLILPYEEAPVFIDEKPYIISTFNPILIGCDYKKGFISENIYFNSLFSSKTIKELDEEYSHLNEKYKMLKKNTSQIEQRQQIIEKTKMELEQAELQDIMVQNNIPKRNVVNVVFSQNDLNVHKNKIRDLDLKKGKIFTFNNGLTPFNSLYKTRSILQKKYKDLKTVNLQSFNDLILQQCEFNTDEQFLMLPYLQSKDNNERKLLEKEIKIVSCLDTDEYEVKDLISTSNYKFSFQIE